MSSSAHSRSLAGAALARVSADVSSLRGYFRPDDDERPGGEVLRALLLTAEGKSLRGECPYLHLETQRIAAERGYELITPNRILLEHGTRDMTAAVASAGGFLVGGGVAPGDVFADGLRATSATLALGVQEVSMGRSTPTIPRIVTDATAVWLTTEGSTITESTPAYGSMPMTPKTVAVYVEVSRQWLLQASAAGQAFVLRSLGAVVAAAVDKAVIQGSGAAGQPLGLLSASGVGSATGASMSWTIATTTIATVENANGIFTPAAAGWAVASDAAKILRQRERAAGSGFILDGDAIGARRAVVSNSVPAGVAVFGDWSQILLGTWGVLEIGADPYGVNSGLFTKGLVGLRAIWTCDVGVLQGASFSQNTGIT